MVNYCKFRLPNVLPSNLRGPSMRTLSIVALALLASSSAFAGDSIRMSLRMKAQNTYARESSTSFRMRHSDATLGGNISASVNGQYVSQAIPETRTAGDTTSGKLEILSGNLVRVIGADGNSIDVKAQVNANGSIHIKGRHFARALRSMIAPQLSQIRSQLQGQGNVGVDINANDFNCAPRADGLVCNLAADISISATQN